MKTRRVLFSVTAVDKAGQELDFSLTGQVKRSIKSEDDVKGLFNNYRFIGKDSIGRTREFSVTFIREVTFLPDRLYINLKSGLACSKGAIQLGDYDDPKSSVPEWRKSPLTKLVVDFELLEGEGISFNDNDPNSIHFFGDFKLIRRDRLLLLNDGSERWIFSLADWEYHDAPISGIDYTSFDNFRDSLPEITSAVG